MKLNCRENDLAVVIRGDIPENIGRVIRVTRTTRRRGNSRVYWEFDGRLTAGIFGGVCTAVVDDVLRPLRGAPGDDETLTWCETPVQREIVVRA